MKKKLLLGFLFVLMLTLTACGKSVELPEDFDTTNYGMAVEQLTASVLQLDDSSLTVYANDAEYYTSDDSLGFGVDVYKALCSGTITAKNEAGTVVGLGDDIEYSMDDGKVVITVPVEFSSHTVNYEYTFSANERAAYNPYVPKYELTQAVVSTQYSMGELMEKAAMNTLMGMGVVFTVLIFISLVISLFRFLPGSGAKQQTKKQEEKAVAQKTQTTSAAPAPAENLMNDKELVAVITAAVMATNGGGAVGSSSDKLVVRSIKRAAR